MTVDSTNVYSVNIQAGKFADTEQYGLAFMAFYDPADNTYDVDSATDTYLAFKEFVGTRPAVTAVMLLEQQTHILDDVYRSSIYGTFRTYDWPGIESRLQELGFIALSS